MFLHKSKRGQSIVEYTLLIGIVVAGILIMQHYVKRGFQGGLKDSADKMGETFSAGGTSILQKNDMASDQKITEEIGTTSTGAGISQYVTVNGTVAKGVYTYTSRTGGDVNITQKTTTESAKLEKYKIADYDNTTVANFNSTNIDF